MDPTPDAPEPPVVAPRISASDEVAFNLAAARAASRERDVRVARVLTRVCAVWLALALLRVPLLADLAWVPALLLAVTFGVSTDQNLVLTRVVVAFLPFGRLFLTEPAFDECSRRNFEFCSPVDPERGALVAGAVPWMVALPLVVHAYAWWGTRRAERAGAEGADAGRT